MQHYSLDKFYLLKFWLGSLLFSSLIVIIFIWVDPNQKGSDSIREIARGFLFINYVALMLSFPAFVLICIVFFLLRANRIPATAAKIILIITTLILILITFSVFLDKEFLQPDIFKYLLAYFIGTITAGLLSKIERRTDKAIVSSALNQ